MFKYKPIPPDEYLGHLKEVLEELSPEQRKRVAYWIMELNYALRELLSRSKAAVNLVPIVQSNEKLTNEQRRQYVETAVETAGNVLTNTGDLIWAIEAYLRNEYGLPSSAQTHTPQADSEK